MAVILLRKLRRRCVLEGTLVVQSLFIDIDSRPRLVLSSNWIRNSIFAVVWPFLSGCWLRVLACRDLGLRHLGVGARTGNVQWTLSDARWVRSWVRDPFGL